MNGAEPRAAERPTLMRAVISSSLKFRYLVVAAAVGLMILGIDPSSPLAKEGVRSGTIVIAVAGKAVNAVTDLQTILNDTPAEQCSLEMAPHASQVVVSGQ